MLLRVLQCFLFLAYSKYYVYPQTTDLILSQTYKNLSTQGKLIPNLYRVPINSRKPMSALRIVLTSEKSKITNPLTLIAVKGKIIQNVILPRVQIYNEKSHQYWFTADTMCEDVSTNQQIHENVYISVASSDPAFYTLAVKEVPDFDIKEDVTVACSPSEPRFYRYTFPPDIDQVEIQLKSDSSICGRVMARSANCPAFDSAGMAEMSDVFFYQSFTKFAFFHVKKKDVGNAFHLIYTVFPDDETCGSKPQMGNNKYRIKTATMTVKPSDRSKVIAILPLLVYTISLLIFLIATYFHSRWLDRMENNEPSIFEGSNSEGTSIVKFRELFEKPYLIVSHHHYEKQRIVKQSKYFNCFYFQIFGALLPCMTTMFQNRELRFKVMNLDACNANFPCSYEILGFRAFNNVTSASSLIFLGIAHLVLVFRKKIFSSAYESSVVQSTHGIIQIEAPKVVCIISMIAFGFFWTVTTICLQKTTIHLFVYTLSWLILSAMMWIYSKRHGTRKWQQTFIIVTSSIFAVFTFSEKNLESGKADTIVMKALLGIFSIAATTYFCHKYCYETPSGLSSQNWIKSPLSCGDNIVPDEKGVYQPLNAKKILALLLIIWTIVWSMLVPFVFPYFNQTKTIINLLKVDFMMFFIYYLIQKIRFEKNTFTISYTLSLIGLTSLFLFSVFSWGLIALLKNPSFVAWTAAHSRELNSACIIPGIDWNDVLHYDTSLICITFIVLMDFIDSNLKGVPRKQIFVF